MFYVVPVKFMVEILQTFVAFLEYMNFNKLWNYVQRKWIILYFLVASILQIWQKVESGSIKFEYYLYHLQVKFTKILFEKKLFIMNATLWVEHLNHNFLVGYKRAFIVNDFFKKSTL